MCLVAQRGLLLGKGEFLIYIIIVLFLYICFKVSLNVFHVIVISYAWFSSKCVFGYIYTFELLSCVLQNVFLIDRGFQSHYSFYVAV